ncbi:hypothetical protein [Chamaesiphon sp. VAR_48_metabat_403]|uniref:hypothetical protein n=1 Tax=Chamaesiphon sp. VAR_48_metabat_403 TaxID=2964700 RepID=UPI00286EB032|nr:hypothetical protein [Chamaesiphon sp. VAR_48_metabat_403]
MILTHYHHQNDRPFQTLSSVSDEEALSIIASLKERTGSVYRRFDNPVEYLSHRRATESWLRNEFIKKGGKPTTEYPQYFVVDKSTWIEEGYNGQSKTIQIPISAFDADRVSFTYPDSMISYWLKSQTDRKFYQPEYHGTVFNLCEIQDIIDRFSIPQREWETDPARKYDIFIEAQVWESIPEWSKN